MSGSDYFEFSSQFAPFLGRIAGTGPIIIFV